MKKFWAGILALLCAFCLYWGASSSDLFNRTSAYDVQAQTKTTSVSAPKSGGLTFTANTFFDTQDLYTTIPHSYEAVIKVTDGGNSRTGIIIGNYFNGSTGTAQAAINFEIGANGVPKVYALMNDGSNATHNFQFNSLASLNTQEGIAGFLNDYFHIAITIDSTSNSALLYINGVLAQTVVNNGVVQYDAMKAEDLKITSSTGEINSLRIGGDYRGSNQQYFKGEIKSVSVFADLRTASEIEDDYSASSTSSVVSSTDNLELCYDLTNADNYYTTVNEVAGNIKTTHVRDLSINANDLTYSVASKSSVGLTFDASTTLKLPTIEKAPKTIEAMLMLPAGTTARAGAIFGNYKDSSGAYLSYEIYNNASPRICAVKPNGTTNNIGLKAIPTGKIVHLTLIYDSANNQAIMYVDGEPAGSTKGSTTMEPVENLMSNNFAIGGDQRTGNGQYFKGTLYSVVAYSDIRSASEVKADYDYAIASNSGFGANVSNDNIICAYDFTTVGGDYYKNSVTGETYTTKVPTTIEDLSANNVDLTATFTATAQSTTIYPGLTVNNDDEYVVSKKFESAPYTFEAVVTVPKTQSVRGSIMSSFISADHPAISYEIMAGGALRIYYFGTDFDYAVSRKYTNIGFSTKINTGLKTHIAIVLDPTASTLKLYINGELKETKTDGVKDFHVNALKHQNFLIGNDHRHLYNFPGYIHSVSAYSNVRSESQIASDYAKVNLNDNNLIAHYDFTSEEERNYADLSGNGNDVSYTRVYFDKQEQPTDYEYSFAVVGDTQVVNYNDPDNFHKIYDWILENKDSKKIKYVFGLGDVTDQNEDAEWLRAQEQLQRFDGVIPYSVIRGNHDSNNKLNTYFGYDAYTNQFNGFYIPEGATSYDLTNSFRTIKIGSVDYLMLTLDWGADDGTLQWANDVVTSFPNHRVIITTHAYLFRDKTLLGELDACPPSAGSDYDDASHGKGSDREKDDYGYNDAEDMWNKFVSLHSNIFLVMSGHDPHQEIVTSTMKGKHGNTVTSMLVDSQGVDKAEGSTGMVAMLYFSNDGKTVEVEWYSTIREKYYRQANQFVMDLDTTGTVDIHNYEHVAKNDKTCTTNGVEEHYYCADCDLYFNANKVQVNYDDLIIPASHELIDVDGKSKTCTEDGYTAHEKCSVCNEEFGKEIIPASHELVEVEAKAKTCTEDGYSAHEKCSVCNEEFGKEIISASHELVEVDGKSKTCTEDGYTAHKACEVCDYKEGYEVIPAGHELINVDGKAKTCTENGYTAHKACEVCDYKEGYEVIPASHELVEVEAKAKTCTENGYTAHEKCSVCNEEFGKTVIEAGHELIDVEAKAKTCTENGYTAHEKCSVCNEEFGKEIIPASHELIDVEAKAKTCTENGYTAHEKCSVCNEEFGKEIIPASHELVNLDGKAKTCTEDGYTAHEKCLVCNEEFGKEIIPAGHELVEVDGKAKTCTEDGYTAHKACEVCDYKEGYEVIPASHELVDVEAKAKTCTENGYTAHEKCSVCNEEFGKEIIPAGHELIDVDGKAKTCTEDGYTAHEKCSVCNEEFGKEIIPAGHELVDVEAKSKTCTENGYTAHEKCSVCNEEFGKEIIPASHELVDVDAKAKTCTEDGYTAHEKCSVCNEEFGKEIIPASHELVDVEAKAKTCTEDGYTAHEKCSVCNEEFGKEIIPASHELVEVEAKAKTCTENGYTAHEKCSVCNEEFGKTVIEAGHTYTFVEEVDSTTENTGLMAHYVCDCGKTFILTNNEYVEVSADSLIIPKKEDGGLDCAGKVMEILGMISLLCALGFIGKKVAI